MSKFRRIYLFRDSSLPEHGWLQSCFWCYSFTSRLQDFKKEENKYTHVMNHYVVFVCKDCQRELKKPDVYCLYNKKCEDYIKSICY